VDEAEQARKLEGDAERRNRIRAFLLKMAVDRGYEGAAAEQKVDEWFRNPANVDWQRENLIAPWHRYSPMDVEVLRRLLGETDWRRILLRPPGPGTEETCSGTGSTRRTGMTSAKPHTEQIKVGEELFSAAAAGYVVAGLLGAAGARLPGTARGGLHDLQRTL